MWRLPPYAAQFAEYLFHQFIRTVTDVRAEWLIEYAPQYYELESFRDAKGKETDTYRALARVIAKKQGKLTGSHVGNKMKRKAGKP